VLVDNCVHYAPAIDPDQLDALASCLCSDLDFHDIILADPPENAQRRFEAQRQKQGYCDECRDFAGRILARFDVTEKLDSGAQEKAAALLCSLSRPNNGFLSIEEASRG
jgi:hypothetical protein